jgi:hypothetical protein
MRALTLAATLALAPLAHAQSATAIDLGALMQREGIDQWQSTTQLAPSLQLNQRWAQFGMNGSLLASDRGLTVDHGLLTAAFAPAPFGPFRWSTDAQAERLTSQTTLVRSALSMKSALSVAVGNGGGWFGAALEASPDVDSIPTRPLLQFGLWQRIGDVMLTFTSASHAARLGGRASSIHTIYSQDSSYNDTTHVTTFFPVQRTFGDSGQLSRTALWSDLELGASWATGPFALDAAVGMRPAVDVTFPRAYWGRLSAVAQVTSRIALIASGGNDPARIALGIPQTRIATLGMRVSTATLLRPATVVPVRTSAAAFSLRPAGDDSYVVSIRVPRARTVELSGDFGHWSAVALVETHPDVWETTLILAPGTYRVNLRVDGDQWKAPPGLPTAADEFNGTVGIVVVH